MPLICTEYSSTNPEQCIAYQGVQTPDFTPVLNSIDLSTVSSGIITVFAALISVYIVLIFGQIILNLIFPKHYDTKRFKSEDEAAFYYATQNARFNRAYEKHEKLLGRELTHAEAGILHKKYFK